MRFNKDVEYALTRLAQRGREAGFHIICSTQRPSAEAVPGALKANLPARLIGKVASGQEALMATGVPGTNAETLMGSGDFVAVIGGQITRFQAAYTGSLDIRYILRQLDAPAAKSGYGRSIVLPESGEDFYAIYDDRADTQQDV